MKPKFIDYFMKFAELTATLSYAKRLQVGAVIVKGNRVIATGYNGMPTDWENSCEDHVFKPVEAGLNPLSDDIEGYHELKTKPEVLHAETNCIAKVAQSTESSEGATLFCTHAPCLDCAKLIYQSGIATVYYKETYRSEDGLNFLKKSGINVHQYSDRT